MSLIIDGSKSGTALSDTATQTLSNKTLVSPVITGTPVFESGTWTPVVVGTSSAGSGSYSTQSGQYHKIGKQVFFTMYVAYSAHTGTGNLRITGLPYTAANTGSGFICQVLAGNLTFSGQLTASVSGNTSQIDFLTVSNNVSWGLVAMDGSAELIITGSYFTA